MSGDMSQAETVYYDAISDGLHFIHKDHGKLWGTPETTTLEFHGIKTEMPNVLGLIRHQVKRTAWNRALKKGWLVKLGRL